MIHMAPKFSSKIPNSRLKIQYHGENYSSIDTHLKHPYSITIRHHDDLKNSIYHIPIDYVDLTDEKIPNLASLRSFPHPIRLRSQLRRTCANLRWLYTSTLVRLQPSNSPSIVTSFDGSHSAVSTLFSTFFFFQVQGVHQPNSTHRDIVMNRRTNSPNNVFGTLAKNNSFRFIHYLTLHTINAHRTM